MEIVFMLMFAALPAIAADSAPVSVSSSVPMQMREESFESDAEDVWTKVRRLILESKREKYGREINTAMLNHDPDAAQKALDGMLRDFPEIKEQQPHAIEYHQGGIYYWRKDYNNAYNEFDKVLKAMKKQYPNGIPRGGKYSELNTYFLADAYFGRGAAALQLKNYGQAVADFDKAIAISPRPETFRQVNKGRALIQLGKFKEAAKAYDEAGKLDIEWARKEEDTVWICRIMSAHGLYPTPCPSKK